MLDPLCTQAPVRLKESSSFPTTPKSLSVVREGSETSLPPPAWQVMPRKVTLSKCRRPSQGHQGMAMVLKWGPVFNEVCADKRDPEA